MDPPAGDRVPLWEDPCRQQFYKFPSKELVSSQKSAHLSFSTLLMKSTFPIKVTFQASWMSLVASPYPPFTKITPTQASSSMEIFPQISKIGNLLFVSDIKKRTKIKTKQTKPSTRIERARKYESKDTLGSNRDEVIKSSVENLVPILSEYEDFSDNESECDVPKYDETSPIFTTFSNPLFDSNDDFTSSDDESLSDEDVPMENFKIYSNPLFDDEEIISPKIDPHYFNAESNLIESLLNRDILIDSSPKFDYLLEEFSGELAHIDPIPPGIEKADFDLEEEIRLVENLLYDNSSTRPPEELNLEIVDTIFESLFPSPILIEDSDSLMEEIDLFLASDDSMPPGIEDDDYDSEGDIRFLEELLNNDSLPFPENESSNLDHFKDPSPSRPPPKPPDVEICFDFKPDTGVVTNKVVGDISEHDVLMPNLLPTQPTFCPVFDFLLSFSSENKDKVFNPGILISPLLSHRGEITSNFYKSPMMISGGDIPHLDVPFLHFYPP
ncbi:hypothetical protein Tco_0305294 [Tanacetum coccineum]